MKRAILLLIILAAGLTIRLWGLKEFPTGIWHDEAQNAIEARQILYDNTYRPVFVGGLSQMAALPFYIFAPFLAAFPDGVYGLRVATVAVGVASILSTFLLAELLFGVETALIAAALLAVMRWHITFSQFGMAMIFTSFFIPLVSYFFLKGVLERRWLYGMLAGIAMGLGLQTYYSMVTLPLLLLGTWTYLVIRREASAGSIGQVLCFFVFAALFYSPIIWYAYNNWNEFTYRFSVAHEASADVIKESVIRHLKMFHIHGDSNGRHNYPGAPMLDVATGVLFGLGVLILIVSCLKWRSIFLLMWLVMCFAAGVFSIGFEAPQAARTLGMTPAVAIISALPLALLLAIAKGHPKTRALLIFLTLCTCAGIGYLNCKMFFVDQRYDYGVWSAFAVEATRIGEIARDESDSSTLYAPPQLISGSTQVYLAGPEKIAKIKNFSRTTDLPLHDDGKNAVVFLEPKERDTVSKILQFYPHASFQELTAPSFNGPTERSALTVVRIPAADIKTLQGLEVTYFQKDSSIKVPTVKNLELDWTKVKGAVDKIVIRGVVQMHKSGVALFQIPAEIPHRVEIFDVDIGGDTLSLGQGGYVFAIELNPPKQIKNFKGSISVDGEEIDPNALFVPEVFRGGLVGQYFPNANAEGPPMMTQLDQQVSFYFHQWPIPMKPYSIVWMGSIQIPQSGEYEIGTRSKDFSSVKVDGREIVNNPESLTYKSANLQLTAGWHPISITFSATDDYNQIYLFWKPPSATEAVVIPSEYFWPGIKKDTP